MDHIPKIIEIRQKVKSVRRRQININQDIEVPHAALTSREGDIYTGNHSLDHELSSDLKNGHFVAFKNVRPKKRI
jgi:hypothetical protein